MPRELVVTALLLSLFAVAVRGDATGSPSWSGHEDGIEEVLLRGEVVARERVGHGINEPWKVTLEHQGETLDAIWKPLPEAEREGYEESARAEVAAYRLSRFLGLHMVPPTVRRRIAGYTGSMQLWVDDAHLLSEVARANPPPGRWSEQVARMRSFDVLIDNPDRNAGNFLVDRSWRVVLIDHSRALAFPVSPDRRPVRKAPALPIRFDEDLVEACRALDLPALDALLGDLYTAAELRLLLRQRDTLVAAADDARRRHGQGALFRERREPSVAAPTPPNVAVQ